MNYIGIDPGLDGGLAFIGNEKIEIKTCVYGIPTLTRKKGKGTKREYNINALVGLLRILTQDIARADLIAYLESVHAMPKQGVVSQFTFGQGFGIWQGLLAALEIPYELIIPQRWKKEMLDGTGKDKEASRLKALRMFPSLTKELSLKKDEGKAEALLIAAYGQRVHNGK